MIASGMPWSLRDVPPVAGATVELESKPRWADQPGNHAVLRGLAASGFAALVLLLFEPGSNWRIPIILIFGLAVGIHRYRVQVNRMAMPFLRFGADGFACRAFHDGRLFAWQEIATVRFSRFGLHVAFHDPDIRQKSEFDLADLPAGLVAAVMDVLTHFRWASLSLPLGGFFLPYSAFVEDEFELKRKLRPLLGRYAPLFHEFIS